MSLLQEDLERGHLDDEVQYLGERRVIKAHDGNDGDVRNGEESNDKMPGCLSLSFVAPLIMV